MNYKKRGDENVKRYLLFVVAISSLLVSVNWDNLNADHTKVLNASNLNRGTVPNERLDLTSVTMESNKLRRDLDALNVSTGLINNSTAALAVSINALNLSTASINTSTGNLEIRVNNLNGSTQTIINRLNTIDNTTATLMNRLNTVDNTTGSLTNRMNTVDNTTATLTNRMNTVDGTTFSLTQTNLAVAVSTLANFQGLTTSYLNLSGSTQTKSGGLTITGTLTAGLLSGNGSSLTNLPLPIKSLRSNTIYIGTSASYGNRVVDVVTTDETGFNNALSSVPPGGTVFVGLGQYTVSNKIKVPEGVRLVAEGPGCILTNANLSGEQVITSTGGYVSGFSFVSNPTWNGSCFAWIGSSAVFENIITSITSSNTNDSNSVFYMFGEHPKLIGLKGFLNFGSGGLNTKPYIIFDYSKDAEMTNCRIEDGSPSGGSGILVYLKNSTNVLVSDSFFKGTSLNYALRLNSNNLGGAIFDRITVETAVVGDGSGVFTTGLSSGTQIRNSHFTNRGAQGDNCIVVDGLNMTVENCTFDNFAVGVQVKNTPGKNTYLHGATGTRCANIYTDAGTNTHGKDLYNGSATVSDF